MLTKLKKFVDFIVYTLNGTPMRVKFDNSSTFRDLAKAVQKRESNPNFDYFVCCEKTMHPNAKMHAVTDFSVIYMVAKQETLSRAVELKFELPCNPSTGSRTKRQLENGDRIADSSWIPTGKRSCSNACRRSIFDQIRSKEFKQWQFSGSRRVHTQDTRPDNVTQHRWLHDQYNLLRQDVKSESP